MDFSLATQTLTSPVGDDVISPLSDAAEAAPIGHLHFLGSKQFPEKKFPIYMGDNLIGRARDARVFIPSRHLSRKHACISHMANTTFIYDCGSHNKTFRREFPLYPEIRYEITDGISIRMGDLTFKYTTVRNTSSNGDSNSSLNLLEHCETDLNDFTKDISGLTKDASVPQLRKESKSFSIDLVYSSDDESQNLFTKKRSSESKNLKLSSPVLVDTPSVGVSVYFAADNTAVVESETVPVFHIIQDSVDISKMKQCSNSNTMTSLEFCDTLPTDFTLSLPLSIQAENKKKLAVTKDTLAVTKDTLAVTKDTVAIKDTLAVTSNTLSMVSDTLAVTSNTLAVVSDTLTETSDILAVTSDTLPMTSDTLAVTKVTRRSVRKKKTDLDTNEISSNTLKRSSNKTPDLLDSLPGNNRTTASRSKSRRLTPKLENAETCPINNISSLALSPSLPTIHLEKLPTCLLTASQSIDVTAGSVLAEETIAPFYSSEKNKPYQFAIDNIIIMETLPLDDYNMDCETVPALDTKISENLTVPDSINEQVSSSNQICETSSLPEATVPYQFDKNAETTVPYQFYKDDSLPEATVPYQFYKNDLLPEATVPYRLDKDDSLSEATVPYQFDKNDLPPEATVPYQFDKNDLPPEATVPYQFDKNDLLPETSVPYQFDKNDLLPDVPAPYRLDKNDSLSEATVPYRFDKNDLLPETSIPYQLDKDDSLLEVTVPYRFHKNDSLPEVTVIASPTRYIVEPILPCIVEESIVSSRDTAVNSGSMNKYIPFTFSQFSVSESSLDDVINTVNTVTENLLSDDDLTTPKPNCNAFKSIHSDNMLTNKNEPSIIKSEIFSTPLKYNDSNESATSSSLLKHSIEDGETSAVCKMENDEISELDVMALSPTQEQMDITLNTPHVMFTYVQEYTYKSIVTKLGGYAEQELENVTHLVTDKVRRTVKFLCCLARGCQLVSTEWLTASKAAKTFLDPINYMIKDKQSEKTFKFKLINSFDLAQKKKLFKHKQFYITPAVLPTPKEMTDIIRCSGGSIVDTLPHLFNPNLNIITCEEDAHMIQNSVFKESNNIYSNEYILTGVLRQNCSDVNFKMNISETKRSGNKRNRTPSGAINAKKLKKT